MLTRNQAAAPLVQGLRGRIPPSTLGARVTLQTLWEVHGLHKLLRNVKGIQATQLLLPEELPPDRQT